MCSTAQKVAAGSAAVVGGSISFILARRRNRAIQSVLDRMFVADIIEQVQANAEAKTTPPKQPVDTESTVSDAELYHRGCIDELSD